MSLEVPAELVDALVAIRREIVSEVTLFSTEPLSDGSDQLDRVKGWNSKSFAKVRGKESRASLRNALADIWASLRTGRLTWRSHSAGLTVSDDFGIWFKARSDAPDAKSAVRALGSLLGVPATTRAIAHVEERTPRLVTMDVGLQRSNIPEEASAAVQVSLTFHEDDHVDDDGVEVSIFPKRARLTVAFHGAGSAVPSSQSAVADEGGGGCSLKITPDRTWRASRPRFEVDAEQRSMPLRGRFPFFELCLLDEIPDAAAVVACGFYVSGLGVRYPERIQSQLRETGEGEFFYRNERNVLDHWIKKKKLPSQDAEADLLEVARAILEP